MIGDLIARIRSDKKVSKTDLSKQTNINVGHLTHIEKGERNPSHKALKSLCMALNVPYQQLLLTYDHDLTPEQVGYNAPKHIIYNSIPVIGNIYGFANVPIEMNDANMVLRVFDDAMEPKLNLNDLVYVQLNVPLSNKDIGLFKYDNKIMIRKFVVRRNDLVLRADKEGIDDIVLDKNADFDIIGKILGSVEK